MTNELLKALYYFYYAGESAAGCKTMPRAFAGILITKGAIAKLISLGVGVREVCVRVSAGFSSKHESANKYVWCGILFEWLGVDKIFNFLSKVSHCRMR